jgi:hypothetical protein
MRPRQDVDAMKLGTGARLIDEQHHDDSRLRCTRTRSTSCLSTLLRDDGLHRVDAVSTLRSVHEPLDHFAEVNNKGAIASGALWKAHLEPYRHGT